VADDRREQWNLRHAAAQGPGTIAAVLRRNRHLIPMRGQALDLACGRGANTLWLAQVFPELTVTAWDYSPVAIERLAGEADQRGLEVVSEVRDIVASPPPQAGYDLVVVTYFLERDLAADIAASLRPGGRLFCETFAITGAQQPGPTDPRFRLRDNELLELFSELQVRYYREDGKLAGETDLRGVALLVAERRA